MKLFGYYCLAVGAAALAVSLMTFASGLWDPLVGDIVASVLVLLSIVGVVAAVMSKVVGFGDAAIPKDKRGILAALRSLSMPLTAVLVLSLAYTVGILLTAKAANVKTIVSSHYLLTTDDFTGEEKRELISAEQFFWYKSQWVRILTSIALAIDVACGTFLLSRAARQSPELKAQIAAGLFSAQVDDSMNL